VSAQLALPEWVRGRGLAIYVTVLFGAISLGSALWGEVAALAGLPRAHFIAAAGALIAIPMTWHWRLHSSAGLDLTPSMHWPEPVLAEELEPSQGPVMVTVEYHVGPANREAFLAALERVAAERRRDGAFAWGVFEDAAQAGRYVETFFVESWMEHLRQHERVTKSDRVQQEKVEALLLSPSKVTHLVAARPGEPQDA
jgi:quinol monooxygenase YgiN